MTTKIKVRNGDIKLPVSETGEGQRLIFFNGLGATQACWNRVIGRLARPYRVTTFDFRGHGKATSARSYAFDDFLGDTEAVMKAVGTDRPVIVAWSMGADLAIWHAATHPNTLKGILIVDGAVPVPQRLVEDAARLRRSLEHPLVRIGLLVGRLTPYGYSLSARDFAEMTVEVDERRQRLLEAYARVDCPISMVLAERTAGKRSLNAERTNKLWHEGAERLTQKYPAIPVRWLDSTHTLPLTNPAEIAAAIDEFCSKLSA